MHNGKKISGTFRSCLRSLARLLCSLALSLTFSCSHQPLSVFIYVLPFPLLHSPMLCFISSFALNSSRSIFASSPFCRFVLLPFRYFFSRFKTEENETHLSKFCSFSLSLVVFSLPLQPSFLVFAVPHCSLFLLVVPSSFHREKKERSRIVRFWQA